MMTNIQIFWSQFLSFLAVFLILNESVENPENRSFGHFRSEPIFSVSVLSQSFEKWTIDVTTKSPKMGTSKTSKNFSKNFTPKLVFKQNSLSLSLSLRTRTQTHKHTHIHSPSLTDCLSLSLSYVSPYFTVK